MQKKTMKYPLSSGGKLKKKDLYLLHTTSNSTHETESLQPQAILPLFLRSPTPHQKSTQKANDYEKKRIKRQGNIYKYIIYYTKCTHMK